MGRKAGGADVKFSDRLVNCSSMGDTLIPGMLAVGTDVVRTKKLNLFVIASTDLTPCRWTLNVCAFSILGNATYTAKF